MSEAGVTSSLAAGARCHDNDVASASGSTVSVERTITYFIYTAVNLNNEE